MQFEIIEKERIGKIIEDNIPFSVVSAILFGGDRLSCCDEAVVMREDESGELVGIATIAFRGESCSGGPEIVGLYILPQHRGQGCAFLLLQETLKRCKERGFSKIGVCVLSAKMLRIIGQLPKETKEFLAIRDQSKPDSLDIFSKNENI